MNERLIAMPLWIGGPDGALTANVSAVVELPFPWTFKCVNACASNDSSATLAASGGVTITATAVGDSGDPTEIEDDSGGPVEVSADEAITFAIDFDGASGTAAANLSIMVIGWIGEGAQ